MYTTFRVAKASSQSLLKLFSKCKMSDVLHQVLHSVGLKQNVKHRNCRKHWVNHFKERWVMMTLLFFLTHMIHVLTDTLACATFSSPCIQCGLTSVTSAGASIKKERKKKRRSFFTEMPFILKLMHLESRVVVLDL